MRMSKEDRAKCGIKAAEARYIAKISPTDLKTIILKLAETIQAPNAYTNDALSLQIDDKPCAVFSVHATKCDLLGWIIKLSYDHWSGMLRGRKSIGHVVSLYIDSHIRTVSEDKLRLLTLGDVGVEYAAQYLTKAANVLSPDNLPQLYRYAKDYESEEDKEKRLLKSAERQAKKLAKKGSS